MYRYTYSVNGFVNSRNNTFRLAFTLVELIVVITILAILGTIAFISLQGYSRDARDSVRTSDMSRIKTSLELFQLDAGKYPETTNKFEVTYKGGETWNQGIFGNSTFNNVEKLDKIPKDPSTDREYIYSVTNTKQEYEIAGIMEGDTTAFNPLLMNVSLAGDKLVTAKVSGNYNGKMLKVSTGGLVHVLAIPSLITSSESTLEDIVTNNNFVYNGYKNLPFQYDGGSYNVDGEEGLLVLVQPDNYELYSGSTLELLSGEDPAVRIGLIQSLQSAYTGTSITEDSTIQEILSITDFTDTNSVVVNLAGTVVNNNLGGAISTSEGVVANEEELNEDSEAVVGNPSLESKTDTTIDLLAGTFTDTDGVQNITFELYSDIGLTALIGEDAGGQFSSLLPSTSYYGVTKGEAYNVTTSSWETKMSSGFSVTTNSPISPGSIVSLLGTNNLTSSNYTASSLYDGTLNSYEVSGAFDGYRYETETPFLSVPGPRSLLGSWTSLNGSSTNQWLTIEFDKPTMATQFSVYPKSSHSQRMPKDVIIQYSNDGTNFIDHESFTLFQGENIDIELSTSTPYVNYIRLYMLNNQDGINPYLQLDEFVLNGYTQD